MNQKSDFGLIGLGVMGKSLALNFADHNFKISAFNRHVDEVEVDVAKKFVEQHPGKNMQGFDDLQAFVHSLH